MSAQQDFRQWYVDVLACLYSSRNAGLVIFSISLPLAERYLRQKAGLGPDDDLNDRFHQEFLAIFPQLKNVRTARQFWAVYRHGFLHQATLSLKTRSGKNLPGGSLSHDTTDSIDVQADGSFCVHPVLFSQQIIAVIESNFSIFEAVGSSAPPLPKVVMQVGNSTGITVPPVTMTTKGGT